MRTTWTEGLWATTAVVLCAWTVPSAPLAADQLQWGQAASRNMVSDEKGLPVAFDPATGQGVKWSVDLGTEANTAPIVAAGKVLVGTNRSASGDPRRRGDCGVLLCLDEATGKKLWELFVPKLEDDRFADWYGVGIMSPPTVEGDRAYLVTNRGEVVCLDLAGMSNGNDGPYRDEGRHMASKGQPALEVRGDDADILWICDMRYGLGVRQHNGSNGSILLDGRLLYVSTSNGVNRTHRSLDAPEAPSLIVLDKRTGRRLARDNAGIGSQIFHGTWSSPSMATVAGRSLVFFGGGDGVCYAFDALSPGAARPPGKQPMRLKTAWRFHCDPLSRKNKPHDFHNNRRQGPSTIIGMPVVRAGRVYVTAGGDPWHGKRQAWLKCIDAGARGDVTTSAGRWSYPLAKHSMATPSVADGLVYVTDLGRQVHCVDAQTGTACWTHKTAGEIWASTLLADGKVYIGSRRGDFWVLSAGRTKRVLHTVRLDAGIAATATAANGTLYVATYGKLWAFQKAPK